MENIIEIENLNKSYKDVLAVNNVSFKVKKGQLFAFLGVNGAGKSTTINIICGSIKKDSGRVFVNGYDLDTQLFDIKSKIGVVFQNSVLDKSLTVLDNLRSRASLYKIYNDEFLKRVKELAQLLDFEHLLNRTVNKLSGGERRRVDIARSLIHNPEILILDEPTTGLDPQSRKTLWNVISNLRKSQNLTVFLTTHYMEEASDADYVVILDSGKIVANGTPLELKNFYTGDYITLYGVDLQQVQKITDDFTVVNGGYKILVPNTKIATQLIIKYPEIFVDYEIVKGKMDDVFLAVTGKKIMENNQK